MMRDDIFQVGRDDDERDPTDMKTARVSLAKTCQNGGGKKKNNVDRRERRSPRRDNNVANNRPRFLHQPELFEQAFILFFLA